MSSATLLHWQHPALNDAGPVCQVLGTGMYLDVMPLPAPINVFNRSYNVRR